jgi:hypothetical protein
MSDSRIIVPGCSRRRLLQAAGAVGAGLALAPLAFGQAKKAKKAAVTDGFYKLVNKTNGRWKDEEIFWSIDYGKSWHSMDAEPSAPCGGNGRIYFSMGKHPKNFDDWGAYWDFVEYNHGAGSWAGNTTQVDAFCLPLTLEMGGHIVGIKEPRSKLFATFLKECPREFQGCVKGDFWIVSPARAGFRKGGPHGNYFDKYVDEVWAMYEKESPTPSGKFTGKVVGGALIYTPVGGGEKTYACSKKPSTQEILLGEGTLGRNPNFCGALNRHVAEDPAYFRDKSKFYQKEPCNWYSKFLHEHAIDHKAYGFCYDDASEQAAYFAAKGDSLTVTFYWD